MNVFDEAGEEHLAIVLCVEVCGLLWRESQPALLQETQYMLSILRTSSDYIVLHVHQYRGLGSSVEKSGTNHP